MPEQNSNIAVQGTKVATIQLGTIPLSITIIGLATPGL